MGDLVPHPYPSEPRPGSAPRQARARGEHTYPSPQDGWPALGAWACGPMVCREFGYGCGKPHGGQGYATGPPAQPIGQFPRTALDAVWSTYVADNAGSGRVMEKNGMIELRREVRMHRGEPRPFIVRGITRAAWDARRANSTPG